MFGKSINWLNSFKKWYDEGNRIPDNVHVIYYDIESLPPDEGPEADIYRMNMMYYCIKFLGGFPNAMLVEKRNNGS